MNANTKYWSMTWDTNVQQKQLPKDEQLRNFLEQISSDFVFQKEKGSKKGKEHFQGVFTLKGPRLSKRQTLKIFEDNFKNVAGLTLSKVHSRVAIEKYVTKTEGRVSGPYHGGDNNMFDKDMQEAKLKSWQKQLYSFLLKARDSPRFRSRKIIFVQDLVGNTGKSFFQKWLRTGQRDITARKLPVNTTDRLISAVTKVVKKDLVDLFMINLTRTQGKEQSYKDLFVTIEDICDGYIVDTMYGHYNECVFKSPVIIIFSNFKLEDFKHFLSNDRWVELVIDSDKNIVYYERNDEHEFGTITPISLDALAKKIIKK